MRWMMLAVLMAAGCEDQARTSAGTYNGCAVADGQVHCWGMWQNGLLGAQPSLVDASGVSVGQSSACALHDDGRLTCWGEPEVEHAPPGDYHRVCVADGWACASDQAGRATCWGDRAPQPPDGLRVADLACGYHHACAVDLDGTVACWGDDAATGRVDDVPAGTFDQVDAGAMHTCASSARVGTVCWGLDTSGQVTTQPEWPRVIAGDHQTCGTTTDGELIDCVGAIGPDVPPYGDTADEWTLGWKYGCARTGRDLECWGDNTFAQSTPAAL